MKKRPPTSGYARISQAEEEGDPDSLYYSDDEDPYQTQSSLSGAGPRYAPIQPRPQGSMHAPSSREYRRPGSGHRRTRSGSGVDIKAINARLERWADEIASKFKISKGKGKTHGEEQLEIQHSVFRAPEGMKPATAESLASDFTESQEKGMTKLEFDDVVESVRVAIELGVHPKMISQGSSGSYFARNTEGKVVGVFKPKDEEPYASRNPKWTKWIHRNLFPCFFGRACLIPNLSYVSEAAAYVLDTRLRTNLVPYTDIVYLSSVSFFYDFWDRRNYYRRKKPFPAKIGSFQVFLKGFKDANIFLREHPWPDQVNQGFRTAAAPKKVKRPWNETCRPSGAASDDEDEESQGRPLATEEETRSMRFFWTPALQQSFREELEKLVILDYIMRNTDRGLDNWMIKVDWHNQEVSIASEPLKLNDNATQPPPSPIPMVKATDGLAMSELNPYKRQGPMAATSGSATPSGYHRGPTISLGAIDNSLSWPWKHPDAWRSFPFGWLFLPVSLIGQPFSQKTRDHFLPILTSTKWWSETQFALRRVFSQDSDFQEKMFARQIAVMKGQAWNVVETLKTPDHGPLELTRRPRICIWDDLVDVPIAVPLRVPSDEMRRRRKEQLRKSAEDEEMDIGAANSAAAEPIPPHDLLNLGSVNGDLPNPNRFDLSRHSSSGDIGHAEDADGHQAPSSPATIQGLTSHRTNDSMDDPRPARSSSRTRMNSEEPHGAQDRPQARRRQYSQTDRRLSVTAMPYADDDLEGDLGYAVAEGREGNQRKVIVERLETVKSKNPVFTWC